MSHSSYGSILTDYEIFSVKE